MMHPKAKEHRSLTLHVDVLRNLPENVIDAILMYLPFRDAVRTSILSNGWRYKWCRLPELTLDDAVWTTKNKVILCTSKITKIISHILKLRAGPITKFVLCVSGSRSCPKIDDLIYFLSRNGIQHLVLRLPFCGDPYKLPSSFFKCLQLRHLTLQNCQILPPPAFTGFDRLISLELSLNLSDDTISSKLLESLISQCLLLEHLALDIVVSYNDVIEINAPVLKSFDFAGSLSSIFLKKVPLLAKLSLTENGDILVAENWDFVKFFESFSALEHLLLNNMFFAANAGKVPTRLPFNLNCVKQLDISNLDLYDSAEVSCALCLIRSFQYLQYMEIQAYCTDDIAALDLEEIEVELSSDATFNHLREVKLELTNCSIIEMLLIKLLLAKSPVLLIQ
ncbi:PREDICTED: F-box/FBD/LRR-repeat protein At1g13570-like isoform X2 [Nicotiana attenuata]|uniref:F-box/FBD/LRR-repeat protein At1g13570-like isoform X2 n=1 Tax=Nicotiana attenuata TaxID=49451 RepID=UPI0009048990|nr:PREDICTED: F-box/FBD/LRR-repeat protein At1g13570-like isoform X2 [Nicotiana attenuata]